MAAPARTTHFRLLCSRPKDAAPWSCCWHCPSFPWECHSHFAWPVVASFTGLCANRHRCLPITKGPSRSTSFVAILLTVVEHLQSMALLPCGLLSLTQQTCMNFSIFTLINQFPGSTKTGEGETVMPTSVSISWFAGCHCHNKDQRADLGASAIFEDDSKEALQCCFQRLACLS